ncbi:MAG: response regulator [Polyangia bacterium]
MPGAPSRTRQKILLVDDSRLCREMTEMVLSRAGFDVIALSSPLRFSMTVYDEAPDLALVDVAMPAFNGDQMVLGARRSLGSLCPIVFYSERSESELKSLVEKCGAAGYIRKTEDWAGFVAQVTRLLRESLSGARSALRL